MKNPQGVYIYIDDDLYTVLAQDDFASEVAVRPRGNFWFSTMLLHRWASFTWI